MSTKLVNAIRSGFVATAVMTLLLFVAPLMGMPKMPIGNMLANFMHIPLALGWIMHLVIGIVLAAGYILFFQRRFSLNPVLDGAIYSLIPFFMAQLIVNPMMGAGIFSMNTPAPMLIVMGSLIGHLVYGAVLGWVIQKATAAVNA